MNVKILVFGGHGQLGQCLKKVADSREIKGLLYLDEVKDTILDNVYRIYFQNTI